MRNLIRIGCTLLLGVGIAWAKGKETHSEKKTQITGPVEAKSGSTLTGTYTVSEQGKQVTIKVDVTNAPAGDHAVHIHEKGDCSSPDGKSAGGHWNPMTEAHGQWGKDHFHLGDIGNMKVGADGKGTITLTTDKWTVGGDPKSDVLNHAIVVHAKLDDFTTQPTGNAGDRIGCGVIHKAP